MSNNTLADRIRQSVTQLTYRELQTSLRFYRDQGLTTVKLNAKKVQLQAELCLILYRQNSPDCKPNHLKAEPEPQPTVDNEYLARGIKARRERMARREQVRVLPILDAVVTVHDPVDCEQLPNTVPVLDDTIVETEYDDEVLQVFDEIYREYHPLQVIKSKRDEITAKVKAYLLRRIRY